MATADKALSFVGQINTTYDAAEKAGANALLALRLNAANTSTSPKKTSRRLGVRVSGRSGVRQISRKSQKKLNGSTADLLRLLQPKRIFLQNAKASARPCST
jgi:hypothetical protein